MQPQEDQPTDARDEPIPPHETVGSALRAARLRLGQDLASVAAVLRIRSTFLQAIEDGQFQALPGAPYAVGFVRTYAEHLGLDGAEMVRRFKSEAAGLERRPSLSFPSPAPEGRVPGTAALLISLVVASVLFGGWYLYQSGRSAQLAQTVPEVPERLANPSGAVPGPTAGGSADISHDAASAGTASAAATPVTPAPGSIPAAPTAGAPSGSTSALPAGAAPAGAPAVTANASPSASAPDGEPVLPPPPGDPTRTMTVAAPPPVAVAPATPAPPAEVEDSPPPEPTPLGAGSPAGSGTAEPAIPPVPQVAALPSDGRVFGAQNSDARVIIKARGESWVQIRDANNTPLLTRVLRAGDSYLVPNKAGLVMMTGNAGVLDVLVDGTPVPPLGAVGAVRRNIALDADRLRAGSAGTE